MANCPIQLLDLPDELLLIIFQKLINVELLYSLFGIAKRLDEVLSDLIFTRRLTLLRSSSKSDVYPLRNEMLDRLCFEILPKIHHRIQCVTVESSSMERVFHVGNYPNLHQLRLVSIRWEGIEQIFDEKYSLVKKFQKQISTLVCSISACQNKSFHEPHTKFVFQNLFQTFPNLVNLQLVRFSDNDMRYFSFPVAELPMFSSSLLRKLHIHVSDLNECLHLLDGRFDQLEVLSVNILIIYRLAPNIYMKRKLDHLKWFSLVSKDETFFYRQSLLPLFSRMDNLERLDLYLIIAEKNFIDGHCLKNDIVHQFRKLNRFTFNIQSRIYEYKQTDIQSNENLQTTFDYFPKHQVISCVDCFPEEDFTRCHYYSSPYTMDCYDHISSHFPGGLFPYVRQISLFDECPFQQEFFLRISQAFPFLQKMTLNNFRSQDQTSDEDHQHPPVVKYSNLTDLTLLDVHDDYIEQFLSHSKSCLPNNLSLSVQYQSLQRVTKSFTREQTRINSAKIQHVFLAGPAHRDLSEDFHHHFPNLQSCRFSLIRKYI